MELTPQLRADRIALCNDVIDRIKNHDLMVRSRSAYLTARADKNWHKLRPILDQGEFKNLDAQDLVDAIEPYCQVCARGAMMLSKARLFNEMPLGMIANKTTGISAGREGTRDALENLFDAEELAQIEAAFELHIMDISNQGVPEVRQYDWGKLRGAWEFGRVAEGKYMERAGSAARCLAVMRNIVANDGVFTFDSVGLSVVAGEVTCDYANRDYPDFADDSTESGPSE